MTEVRRVDLNCDLGESFGAYTLGHDEQMMASISSANVACGFHAGDPSVMRRTLRLAVAARVGVGAHPGFPDLVGFGRRTLGCTADEAEDLIVYQTGALAAMATAEGTRLRHVKPHGALYNQASADPALADAVARGVRSVDPELVLFGLAGSVLLDAGRAAGLAVASEVFADRAYDDDGALVDRRRPGAVITDPDTVAARAVEMVVAGRVRTASGQWRDVRADTICVHGDTPGAVALARRIRTGLERAGVRISGPCRAR